MTFSALQDGRTSDMQPEYGELLRKTDIGGWR